MMKKVNICILPGMSHPQIRSLFEVAEGLLLSYREALFDVTISLQDTKEGRLNIVVGAHLATAEELASLPAGSIIWNTEIASRGDRLIDLICALSEHCEIWDSSLGNCALLKERGVAAKHFMPCFTAGQIRIPRDVLDVDVVIWGAPEGRRGELVTALVERGLRVDCAVGKVGAEWEARLARARIYLDVLEDGERPSVARQSLLLHNGIPVIAAWGDCEIEAPWNTILHIVSGDVVEQCVELLSNTALCAQTQRKSQAWLQTRIPRSILRHEQSKEDVTYFCVCHVDPMFQPPESTRWVFTGRHEVESESHISKISPESWMMYRYIAGTAASFAIMEKIKKDGVTGSVNILQYRKFISKRALGSFSNNYPGLVVVGRPEERDQFIVPIEETSGEYCISVPITVGNMLAQYAMSHRIEDILRFCQCAVATGVVAAADVVRWFNHPIHIPGGIEFGKFPADVFVSIVSKLQKVCQKFLEKYEPVEMSDPYQSRGLSFCCERLGGWLLMQHLEERFGLPFADPRYVSCFGNDVVFGPANPWFLGYRDMFGFMHCIEEDANPAEYTIKTT